MPDKKDNNENGFFLNGIGADISETMNNNINQIDGVVEGTVNITSEVNPDKYSSPREAMMDVTWVKDSFILPDAVGDRYNRWLKRNRFFSTADVKSTGTTVGLNISINPQPQITRYADIRRPGVVRVRDGEIPMRVSGVPNYKVNTNPHYFGLGLGRYYDEAIENNQQKVFMRFGEPQYTSVLLWLGRSFDIHKAMLYKRGTISRLLLDVIQLASSIFSIVAAPLMYGTMLVLNFFIKPNKFVSLRDNMYTYWTMVETLLNSIYVKRTNVPFKYSSLKHGADTNINKQPEISENFIKGLNNLIPGVVDPNTGRISVHAIALRGQAAFNSAIRNNLGRATNDATSPDDVENYRMKNIYDEEYQNSVNAFSNADSSTEYAAVNDASWFTKWYLKRAHEEVADSQVAGQQSYTQGVTEYMKGISNGTIPTGVASLDEEDDLPYTTPMNDLALDSVGNPLTVNISSKEVKDSPDVVLRLNMADKADQLNSFGSYYEDSITAGAAFLVLNVDSTGSIGESFSNSSEANPIETLFNSISTKIRAMFNTMHGVTELPFIGAGLKFLANAGANILVGATAGLASPLVGLLYSTTMTLPKSWSNSSASLPRANYKVKLTSVYGNAYSQLFSMYLPLSAIMVASLPRSTGADTYTAPFMLQTYDRGRVNIEYGMVESLSITRGTSNLAFTRASQPNAIDIDISIVDLNQLIALDLDDSGLMTKTMNYLTSNYPDRNIDNYVNTLTGVDVYRMFQPLGKARMRIIEDELYFRSIFTDSAAQAAFVVANVPFISSLPSIFGANRAVEEAR